MFTPGQSVTCIDEKEAFAYNVQGNYIGGMLTYMQTYIVLDCKEGFVTLEAIRGEWHESRFIASEDV